MVDSAARSSSIPMSTVPTPSLPFTQTSTQFFSTRNGSDHRLGRRLSLSRRRALPLSQGPVTCRRDLPRCGPSPSPRRSSPLSTTTQLLTISIQLLLHIICFYPHSKATVNARPRALVPSNSKLNSQTTFKYDLDHLNCAPNYDSLELVFLEHCGDNDYVKRTWS